MKKKLGCANVGWSGGKDTSISGQAYMRKANCSCEYCHILHLYSYYVLKLRAKRMDIYVKG